MTDDIDRTSIAAQLGYAQAEITRLKEQIVAERRLAIKALETAIDVAGEAREEWDKAPAKMKAGKLLIALSESSFKYRADITAMHTILATLKEKSNG